MTSIALTIAGSDPSGGAGIQADLKTFHQHGVYGMSVVTLLTVQNTQSVNDVVVMQPDLVLGQLDAVLGDIPPHAAKTGALGNAELIEAVAAAAENFQFPLIVDPVMISKHGAPLIADDAVEVLCDRLLPNAFLVTPNLAEAERITGRNVDSIEAMEDAARAVRDIGPANVLIKGGHLEGDAIDVLLADDEIFRFQSPRHETKHTHGTGCVTSAAITARLARNEDLNSSVRGAKKFITAAIESNPELGGGHGPVNLFAPTDL
ncbi:MAG: bifunctional hydroxymethylpyrimidine kinase/phosphomethylpyrimidine kinase [Planctomycetota bacterium]